MTAPLLVALPGNEDFTGTLAVRLGAEIAKVEFRRFPDEESYVRYDAGVSGRSLAFVCTLDRPDSKLLPLLFAAGAARDLGAARVGLLAPYLAYMRQDTRFKTGEAVTSALFARLLSQAFDWMVTIDPHLHRLHGLGAIYSIPAVALHAAPLISKWIRDQVPSPVLVGPDAESEQWVGAVAQAADAPFVILQKIRRGDFDVEVSLPHVERWRNCTPVLVDDIISTGRTMIETLGHLKSLGMKPAVCIGVHAVFSSGSYRALRAAGPLRIVTTNTIAHETNAIDVAPLLAPAVVQAAA